MVNWNKVLLYLVFLCVIVTLVTVLGVVWSLPEQQTTLSSDYICLPESKDTSEVNCGFSASVLHEYLIRVIESESKKMKEKEEIERKKDLARNEIQLKTIYSNNYWEMLPAAKLTGTDQPMPSDREINADMTPIREWRNGRSLTDVGGFLRYGVTYRNGRLVVPVSGIYFTYSFVDFYEECKIEGGEPIAENISKPIKHALYKFNIKDGNEKEIISSVQSHKMAIVTQFNSYASYISSLVELEAGDELSVKVSNITLLKYTRENYFGLNLV